MIRKFFLVVTLAPVVLLLGGLSYGDVMIRHGAESGVESAVRAHVPGVGDAQAHIHSFPFVVRLLGGGEVPRLDLDLVNVTGHGIGLASLGFEVTKVKLDRKVLFDRAHVRIKSVEAVTVRATISEAEIRRITGAEVHLGPGTASVTVRGVSVPAALSVAAGRVRLGLGRFPAVSFPLPSTDLLPCPLEAVAVAGAVEATCTAAGLPKALLDAIGTAALPG